MTTFELAPTTFVFDHPITTPPPPSPQQVYVTTAATMNLTLASHHHYPHGSSMEQLECREGLTKQWLLDQRCGAASFHIPSPRLISSTAGETTASAAGAITLGTTFPPQAHMLHAFRERLRQMGGRNTCHSEPDLSHGLFGKQICTGWFRLDSTGNPL